MSENKKTVEQIKYSIIRQLKDEESALRLSIHRLNRNILYLSEFNLCVEVWRKEKTQPYNINIYEVINPSESFVQIFDLSTMKYLNGPSAGRPLCIFKENIMLTQEGIHITVEGYQIAQTDYNFVLKPLNIRRQATLDMNRFIFFQPEGKSPEVFLEESRNIKEEYKPFVYIYAKPSTGLPSSEEQYKWINQFTDDLKSDMKSYFRKRTKETPDWYLKSVVMNFNHLIETYRGRGGIDFVSYSRYLKENYGFR